MIRTADRCATYYELQPLTEEIKKWSAKLGALLLAYRLGYLFSDLLSRPGPLPEVALMLCRVRKAADGAAAEPSEPELNSIRFDEDKVKTVRRRLSEISWWMRLLSQRVAQKANVENQIAGKFWQSRYRAVRLIEDEVSLACAAYMDLNPTRAGIAQTIEDSKSTSARLRLQTIADAVQDAVGSGEATGAPVGEENHAFERPNLTATGSAQKR